MLAQGIFLCPPIAALLLKQLGGFLIPALLVQLRPGVFQLPLAVGQGATGGRKLVVQGGKRGHVVIRAIALRGGQRRFQYRGLFSFAGNKPFVLALKLLEGRVLFLAPVLARLLDRAGQIRIPALPRGAQIFLRLRRGGPANLFKLLLGQLLAAQRRLRLLALLLVLGGAQLLLLQPPFRCLRTRRQSGDFRLPGGALGLKLLPVLGRGIGQPLGQSLIEIHPQLLPDEFGVALFLSRRRDARRQVGDLGVKRGALGLKLLPVLGHGLGQPLGQSLIEILLQMLPDNLGITVFFTLRRDARGQFGDPGLKRQALCLQLLPVLGDLRAERGAPSLQLLLMRKSGLVKSLIERGLQALFYKPGIAGSFTLLLFKLRMQQPHLGFAKGNQGLHVSQLAGHTVLVFRRLVGDGSRRCAERDREVEHLQGGRLPAVKRGDADGQDMVAGRLGRNLVCHIIQFIGRQRPGPVAVSLSGRQGGALRQFLQSQKQAPASLEGRQQRTQGQRCRWSGGARNPTGRRAGKSRRTIRVQHFCCELRSCHAEWSKTCFGPILDVCR